jgi:hypothetical protein
MFRKQWPRIYELWDLIADPSSPDAYLPEEDVLRSSSLAQEFYASLEKELQGLDEDPWKSLRSEAARYLSVRDKRRDWHQLFNILNQAYAYNHLRAIGCSNIRFIPRSKAKGVKTPDLEGSQDGVKVVCEVKSIGISDSEIDARRTLEAQDEDCLVGQRFFKRLTSAITEARSQLLAYDPAREARQLVYVCARLDSWPSGCDEQQYQQIDRYLSDKPTLSEGVIFRINGKVIRD